jgi:hypothetical protein
MPTESMGVYYTKTEEKNPVFHVFRNCARGQEIKATDRVDLLTDRHYCDVCAVMQIRQLHQGGVHP